MLSCNANQLRDIQVLLMLAGGLQILIPKMRHDDQRGREDRFNSLSVHATYLEPLRDTELVHGTWYSVVGPDYIK